MPDYFQDDSREQQMRKVFGLEKDGGRIDSDGFLTIGTCRVDFELKTTGDSSRSVTTVRDFGMDHVNKWKTKHWIFAFYEGGWEEPYLYLYGSPRMMAGWIQEKSEYIAPDIIAADRASSHLTVDDLIAIVGNKTIYTLEDAKKLHKKQWDAAAYQKAMDVRGGYSQARMLQILKARVRYLVERGSTLNNPHINWGYLEKNTVEIKSNHAQELRRLVGLAIRGQI